MTDDAESYRNIPGTIVFDSVQCRSGYHLNMWCLELMKEEKRREFKADERAFLEKYALTAEQRQAVLERDYNRLLSLGGNIYFLSKIAYVDGDSFQMLAARMSGVTLEEFRAMMLSGGRSPHAALTVPKE
ncbi:MAG: protocatechuate 4,5-dioxygenase alpha subunit [Noviherbaspirillum sp.]|jgi:protocatechuate 4,5-dioxygenase alpha chain|nr:protocatechuate 4,5-dioxygenase alpha subunit [Noviherbaspirillum sp.]